MVKSLALRTRRCGNFDGIDAPRCSGRKARLISPFRRARCCRAGFDPLADRQACRSTAMLTNDGAPTSDDDHRSGSRCTSRFPPCRARLHPQIRGTDRGLNTHPAAPRGREGGTAVRARRAPARSYEIAGRRQTKRSGVSVDGKPIGAVVVVGSGGVEVTELPTRGDLAAGGFE